MDLTSERWARIREVFDKAIAVPRDEVEAWISARCDGDLTALEEVRKLLAGHWRTTSILGSIEQQLIHAEVSDLVGLQIGAYELLEQIGHGGMGAVYRASRADGVMRKSVAIKLIRAGLRDDIVLDRFRRERDILASLDHPGIARLIDAGSAEGGLPYLIMDYVDGQPIDRWCDERRLNVAERLKLFRSICAVVQYAHDNSVVHRDLKPGNILVTADGTVKLLDFGIAKLLEPQPAAGSLALTGAVMPPMTIAYASPEQIRGERISVRTDIYSLGVVLYELLTGRLPYDASLDTPYEISKFVLMICEQAPILPSTAAAAAESASSVREGTSERLKRRLEGDLDNILLMALRKEQQRRYSSVQQLSDDLRRHLEHLPVVARQNTVWYRAGKLIRRHPIVVAVSALIVLSTLLGFVTLLWATRVATEERTQMPRQTISNERVPSPEETRIPADQDTLLHLRRILGPQLLFGFYLMLVTLAATIYLTRAPAKRAAAALAGGAIFMFVWIQCNQFGYSMGWWHSNYPGIPNPMSLLSTWIMMIFLFNVSSII